MRKRPAMTGCAAMRTPGDDGTLSEIHVFEQVTEDREWLIYTPAQPIEDVQVVRIETLETPSWVAWIEIQVIGER